MKLQLAALLLAALLAPVVAGCERMGWVRPEDRAPFESCVCVWPTRCDRAGMQAAEEWASLPAEERIPWLERRGCENWTSGGEYVGGSGGGGSVRVRGYRRRDGTWVSPHTRRRPR